MYCQFKRAKGFVKISYKDAYEIIRRMVESGDYGCGRISFKLNI